uniref:hypothetical protein n=1 Tax=Haloarcula laminariae TaxID=2961577 RepID=UPI0024049937
HATTIVQWIICITVSLVGRAFSEKQEPFLGETCHCELARDTQGEIEYGDTESTDSSHRVGFGITGTNQLLGMRAY